MKVTNLVGHGVVRRAAVHVHFYQEIQEAWEFAGPGEEGQGEGLVLGGLEYEQVEEVGTVAGLLQALE